MTFLTHGFLQLFPKGSNCSSFCFSVSFRLRASYAGIEIPAHCDFSASLPACFLNNVLEFVVKRLCLFFCFAFRIWVACVVTLLAAPCSFVSHKSQGLVVGTKTPKRIMTHRTYIQYLYPVRTSYTGTSYVSKDRYCRSREALQYETVN
jgi:hypothetical protein